MLDDNIHEFIFYDSSNTTVDEYIEMWHTQMPAYWRSQMQPGDTLRVLLDFCHAGLPFGPYIVQRLREYGRLFPDRPPLRIAYLHSGGPLVSSVQTISSMAELPAPTERAYFLRHERAQAVEWLLQGLPGFSLR